MPPKPTLDIKQSFAAIRERYATGDQNTSLNILLLGETGTGKTFFTRTCPGPVFIDSFDRGGSKGLKKWIDDGSVIVDSRWENEDPFKPTVFKDWAAEMKARANSGFFDYIGTYVLDSTTTWAQAIMNNVLKGAGIAGQTPRFTHDYGPVKTTSLNWMQKLLNLPCNFVAIGHLEIYKDEVSKKTLRRLLTTGKNVVNIPLLFDEVWVTDPKETSSGIKYRVLTQSTGVDLACSRLAQDGKLAKYEDPDLTAIMKKAGWKGRKPKPLED